PLVATSASEAPILSNLLRLHMRTIATQKVVPFTGEGAYHGSTKPRASAPAPHPLPVVEEMRATTVERYAGNQRRSISTFDATFPSLYEHVGQLPVPMQDEIQNDGITFVWTPLGQALAEAGPLTRRVLQEMQKHLRGTKRNIYIDSKIQ